jgi:hypothetical protein
VVLEQESCYSSESVNGMLVEQDCVDFAVSLMPLLATVQFRKQACEAESFDLEPTIIEVKKNQSRNLSTRASSQGLRIS